MLRDRSVSGIRNLKAYGDATGNPGCLLQEAVSKPAAHCSFINCWRKGQDMSEQKESYMASLAAWSDKSIIEPLADAYLRGPEEVIISAQEYARKAIRTKVLESYRNGQAAGPRKTFKRQ
jgi:hypothetical protein